MATIPPFDHNCVLPPYFGGNPTDRHSQSPYFKEIMDFCKEFSFSPARIQLLKDFVLFRIDMYKYGINNTIQWIDGSFVEDKVRLRGSEPNDIDALTFVMLDNSKINYLDSVFPEFLKSSLSKKKYHVDHYPLDISSPHSTIRNVSYWLQLFSHNRMGVWKGMIEIPVYNDDSKDQDALTFLNSL